MKKRGRFCENRPRFFISVYARSRVDVREGGMPVPTRDLTQKDAAHIFFDTSYVYDVPKKRNDIRTR
jgi:hypothetical protein